MLPFRASLSANDVRGIISENNKGTNAGGSPNAYTHKNVPQTHTQEDDDALCVFAHSTLGETRDMLMHTYNEYTTKTHVPDTNKEDALVCADVNMDAHQKCRQVCLSVLRDFGQPRSQELPCLTPRGEVCTNNNTNQPQYGNDSFSDDEELLLFGTRGVCQSV